MISKRDFKCHACGDEIEDLGNLIPVAVNINKCRGCASRKEIEEWEEYQEELLTMIEEQGKI